MLSNFYKKLLSARPSGMSRRQYNLFLVIRFTCFFVFIILLISSLFFYTTGLAGLLFLNTAYALVWIYIWHINNKGKLQLCLVLIAITVLAFVVGNLVLFGWSAGFQYYLICLATILLFHPFIRVNLLVTVFAGLLILSLSLYLLAKHPESTYQADQLYLFNFLMAFSFMAFVIVYFRFDIEKLIQTLNHSARTDQLTGLLNRHSMQIELNRHVHIVQRHHQACSLILFDIDFFKRINDQYGHICGDDVLVKLSELLQQRFRETDFVARWGGEEFLALLPFTGKNEAYQIAEELRGIIENYGFCDINKGVRITITAGVYEIQGNQSIETALSRVDKLLYYGKENGRNQVISPELALS